MYRVSVDVGGTFTDCLVLDERSQHIRQFKVPTVPSDPSSGLMAALEEAARAAGAQLQDFVRQITLLIHGTTLATNTLITRTGAKTGMVTTEGFRDIIEIRRGHKNVGTSMYNLFVPPYRPLVPRRHRHEVAERMLYDGTIHTPVDVSSVEAAAQRLKADRVEAVVVGLLHSYANAEHEQKAAVVLKKLLPEAYISVSSEVLPIWREWERFSTAVTSAYVGPVVARYLAALVDRLAQAGFGGLLLMVLSDGQLDTPEYCKPRAVYLIGSGPAAAPSSAVYLAAEAGVHDVLSVDMGGTSFDICMVRGREIPRTGEGWVEGERIAIKMVDIQTGGAGGGSIAWVDQLGLLRVGPQSAGAKPGPACYGRGGYEPTVTDADVVLGYIPTDTFLGGAMPLSLPEAERAVGRVASVLGMTTQQAAEAIYATVNSYMADMIAEVATRRGHDVRQFTLVAGGGAGGLHAPSIAEVLGVTRVIVPRVASTYSAFGMLAMSLGRNYARSCIVAASNRVLERIDSLYETLEAEALNAYTGLGVPASSVQVTLTADMRYVGQFHEVEVAVPRRPFGSAQMEAAIEAFHTKHKELYAFDMRWQSVEFLTLRAHASVGPAPFKLERIADGGPDAAPALARERACIWNNHLAQTRVYAGPRLLAGNIVDGPAIVEEALTTILVPPGWSARVDAGGNYWLTSNRDATV